MTKAIKVQFLFPQTILRYDSFLVFSLSMFEIPFLVNFHLSFFYSSKLKVKKILSWLSEFLWCFVVSQEVEVNLIITDYCMPGMTGYDLLKKIKVCFWFLLLCLLSRPSWYSLSAFSPIFPIEDLFFFLIHQTLVHVNTFPILKFFIPIPTWYALKIFPFGSLYLCHHLLKENLFRIFSHLL